MTNKNAKNTMTEKDINAMTYTVKTADGEKVCKLVKYLPDVTFIDTDIKVTKDYKLPKIAVKDSKEDFYPVYYAVQLFANFKKDEKNNTTEKDKDKRAEINAKIMENAKGFKAVCRDLSTLAEKENGKGFLKITASLPCPETVNINKSACGFWLFTSESLRENFLKMVQCGIIDGKYLLQTGEKAKSNKPIKAVIQLQKILKMQTGKDVSYEEAYKMYKATK